MQVLKGKFFFFIFLIFFFFTSYQFKIKEPFFLPKVKSVSFIGSNNLEENIKDEVINFLTKKNLFYLESNNLSNLLKKSKWLKSYQIKKKYPSHIDIILKEHKPIAILNNNFLINDNYEVTDKIDIKNKLNLIYIRGEFNNKKFRKIYIALKNKKIFSKIIELHFLNLGRWDIYLNNNIHVKMNSNNIEKQVSLLNVILSKKKNIRNIDLRNEDIAIIK